MPPQSDANAPVDAPARLRGLDALRGVALLGILLANVRQMFLPWSPAEFPVSFGGSQRVAWIDWQLFHSLVDLKFLTLFSLLFGVGFALQSERRRTNEEGFVGIYLRRVGILAAFGLAHGLLLYPAEVLLPYAVAGLLLLVTHRWLGTTLIRSGLFLVGTATIWQYQIGTIRPIYPGVIASAALLLAVTLIALWRRSVWVALTMFATIVFLAGWVLTSRAVPDRSGSAQSEYREAQHQLMAMSTDDPSVWPEELRVRREEGFNALVQLHARQYSEILLAFVVVLLWRTLGLFMVGAGLFRVGVFTRAHGALWSRVALIGLGVGLPLSVLATWLYGQELQGFADWRLPALLHSFSALPLAAGIAGAVFVLHRGREHHWLWTRVEAAGRMPLTNYVGQSWTMAAMAEPWGFDGYARVGAPLLTGLAVVVFMFLAIVSHRWLASFRMGPLEWVWRCGTYWRVLPNRST